MSNADKENCAPESSIRDASTESNADKIARLEATVRKQNSMLAKSPHFNSNASSAQIDKMAKEKKESEKAGAKKKAVIERPKGPIRNLQDVMGMGDNSPDRKSVV